MPNETTNTTTPANTLYIVCLPGSSMVKEEVVDLQGKHDLIQVLFMDSALSGVGVQLNAANIPSMNEGDICIVTETSKVNLPAIEKRLTDDGLIIYRKEVKGFKDKAMDQLQYGLTGLDRAESAAIMAASKDPAVLDAVLQSTGTVASVLYNYRRLGGMIHGGGDKSMSGETHFGFGRGVKNRLQWAFLSPFKLAGASIKQTIAGFPLSRLLFNVSLLLLAFLMPYLSKDFGISGDEFIHDRHAGYVYNYFQNGDETALDQPQTLLHYYGQTFDYLAYWLIQKFDIEANYDFRHLLNAIFGYLGILFAALLAARIFGYRAGLFAVLLLAVSPRYIGQSMNNPLDIPFATGYIMGLYYMIKYFKGFPYNRWSTGFMMALGIALAISIRVGGILLLPYVVMLAGLMFAEKFGWKKTLSLKPVMQNKGFVLTPLFMGVAGFFLSLQFWPYALQAPIGNTFTALEELTNIKNSMSQLFEGHNVFSNNLPWHYIPKFVLITIPIAVIAGFIVSFLPMLKDLIKGKYVGPFIMFTAVFPVAYLIYKHSNVYGGWRHVIFIYPSMVVMASLGWHYLTVALKHKLVPIVVSVIFTGLIMLPARWMVANYPYEYVYFNEFTGGVKGAYGKYELDYYFRCLKQASEWLIENEDLENRKDTLIIASNHGSCAEYYFRKMPNIKVKYIAYYDRSKKDWDYGLFVNSYINVHQLNQGYYPPPNAMHSLMVEGKPIATILKRTSKEDKEGFDALFSGNNQLAIQKFNSYLSSNPPTAEVLYGLAAAQLQSGMTNEAIGTANKALQYHPEHLQTLQVLGQAYMNLGQYSKAEANFRRITEIKPGYPTGHYYLAVCYYNQKQFELAIQAANNAIQVNPGFAQGYQLIGACYQQLGDQQTAQQYFQQAAQLGGQR